MAFVRLARGQFLGNLTEVPLPVRFLFVLMGPAQGHLDYHQIGRSISTLMANTVSDHKVILLRVYIRHEGKVSTVKVNKSFQTKYLQVDITNCLPRFHDVI